MTPNESKTLRQLSIRDRWIARGCAGTLVAVTGFGKTRLGMMVIERMLSKGPSRTTLVVVPTAKLKKQWEERLTLAGLTGVTVMTIQTLIRRGAKGVVFTPDLLILDEIHVFAATKFSLVFEHVRYRFVLGLTATIERNDMRHLMLRRYAPVFDEVNMVEARANKWVSDFVIYNVAIPLTEQEREQDEKLTRQIKAGMAIVDNSLPVCIKLATDKEFREEYCRDFLGWDSTMGKDHEDSPESVVVIALRTIRAIQARRKMLYTLPAKKEAMLRLMKEIEVKTITFSMDTAFADELTKALPEISFSYHTKTNKKEANKNMELFNAAEPKKRIVNSALALDLGLDVSGLELGIIGSSSGTARQDLQRSGRNIRWEGEAKLARIVNLYVPGTKDEDWLKRRQKKTDQSRIIWTSRLEDVIEGVLPAAITTAVMGCE